MSCSAAPSCIFFFFPPSSLLALLDENIAGGSSVGESSVSLVCLGLEIQFASPQHLFLAGEVTGSAGLMGVFTSKESATLLPEDTHCQLVYLKHESG